MSATAPSVLCVDNYDSFVYTIVGYLRRLGAAVTVVRNDDAPLRHLGDVDGVLVSPGPSDPTHAGDSLAVIDACASERIPMLGVCLGHQALGQWAGGEVVRADKLMHGKTSLVHHTDEGVFQGLPNPIRVTRYHSLTLHPHTLPSTLAVTATTEDGVIQGIRHRELPLEGVQFHPEAVMTQYGYAMFARWLCELGADPGLVAHAHTLTPALD